MEPREPGLCIDLCEIWKSNILGFKCSKIPTILFEPLVILFDLHKYIIKNLFLGLLTPN